MVDSTGVVISLLCYCSIVSEHATTVWLIAQVWLLAYFVSAILSVNSPQITFCMGDSTRVVISLLC